MFWKFSHSKSFSDYPFNDCIKKRISFKDISMVKDCSNANFPYNIFNNGNLHRYEKPFSILGVFYRLIHYFPFQDSLQGGEETENRCYDYLIARIENETGFCFKDHNKDFWESLFKGHALNLDEKFTENYIEDLVGFLLKEKTISQIKREYYQELCSFWPLLHYFNQGTENDHPTPCTSTSFKYLKVTKDSKSPFADYYGEALLKIPLLNKPKKEIYETLLNIESREASYFLWSYCVLKGVEHFTPEKKWVDFNKFYSKPELFVQYQQLGIQYPWTTDHGIEFLRNFFYHLNPEDVDKISQARAEKFKEI